MGFVALAGAVALLVLRSGTFDARQPQGMIVDACPSERTAAVQEWTFGTRLLARLKDDWARQRLRDWPSLCQYQRENDRRMRSGIRPQVVMIGDSITWRWSLRDPDFFGVAIANRGIEMQTSPQMLLRFHQDVVALRPRVVHLMVGLNDIVGASGPNRPEDYRNNIRAMVDIAQANGIAVVVGGITPAWRRPSEPDNPRTRLRAELNRWLRTYAAERGAVFAHYEAVLIDANGQLRTGFFEDDGVHLTAAGYAAMRPVAEAAIAAAGLPGGTASRGWSSLEQSPIHD